MIDTNGLCRVCALTNSVDDLVDIYEKVNYPESIADTINELTALKVDVNDGLPRFCCIQCQSDLFNSTMIRRKCIEAEKKIKSILLLNSVEVIDAIADSSEETRELELVTNRNTSGKEETEFQSKPTKPKSICNVPSDPHYRCCGCGVHFETEMELKEHSLSVHAPNAPLPDESRPKQCNICYRLYKTERGVRDHQVYMRARQFQCASCGQQFRTAAYLLIHENLHTKAMSFPCNDCGELFHNVYSRRKHVKSEHASKATETSTKEIVCPECGKVVRCDRYLKEHMKLHTTETPHQCTVCGAQFKLNVYLAWHMKKHSGLFSCKYCYVVFKCASELKQHQNRHTGYKEFSCTTCEKSFYTKKDLYKHRRTHERRKRIRNVAAKAMEH